DRGREKMFGAIFTVNSAPALADRSVFLFVSAPNPHPIPSGIVRQDEPELVASARAGDSAAFEELVARYEDKIFRLTINITGNREDAEDAMQDAFLKAFAHLDNFHGDSRFYTWLVRIAANEALMRLRKRRPNQFSIDQPVEGESDLMPRKLEEWTPTPKNFNAKPKKKKFAPRLEKRGETN